MFQSPLVIASFLDPRFKTLSFVNDHDITQVHTLVCFMMQNEAHFQLEESARKKPSALDFLLGDDSNDLEYMSPGTSKLQRYLLELQISRNENPLKWWENNESRYPCLASLAKKYLAFQGLMHRLRRSSVPQAHHYT